MKKILLIGLMLLYFLGYSQKTTYQKGYTKQNGTNVEGHYKTSSDNKSENNYNTSGNTNPHTGERGSRPNNYSSEASNYGQGQQIQTGSRGGQYYINGNGNKTYVPKR